MYTFELVLPTQIKIILIDFRVYPHSSLLMTTQPPSNKRTVLESGISSSDHNPDDIQPINI